MAKKKKKLSEPYVAKAPVDIWALPDGHHYGLRTGFDKVGGAVYPAPTHTQPMESIRIERVALQDFIDAMQAHIHREYKKLALAESGWWGLIETDLGIKRGSRIAYHYMEHCFKRTPEEPQSVGAVDPHANSTGKLSPREKELS